MATRRIRTTQRILSREPLTLFPETLRICTRCRGQFPRTDFYADKSVKDGLAPDCRYCASKDATRHMIKRVYGLTPDQFDAMLSRQQNRCACCDRELEIGQKRHIDHCHDTGRIRGILCRRCNVGIAMAEHSIERLRQMIAYLEQFTN